MMKKLLRLAAAAATASLLLPVAAQAQKVSYDFDKTADFAKFKTFALRDGTKSGNPLVDGRITAALEAALATKGLKRNDTSPDVYVVTHLTFETKKDITTFSTGPAYGAYGWRWGGGWGTTDVRVNDILVGTLVIDLADASKQELVWRGIGVKEVDPQPKPEKVDKNVKGAVAKILKNYPPKKKK